MAKRATVAPALTTIIAALYRWVCVCVCVRVCVCVCVRARARVCVQAPGATGDEVAVIMSPCAADTAAAVLQDTGTNSLRWELRGASLCHVATGRCLATPLDGSGVLRAVLRKATGWSAVQGESTYSTCVPP